MSKFAISSSLASLSAYPWKSVLLVTFVAITFVFNILWLWGFFWIAWALTSVHAGEVVFLDIVTRVKHPYFFWVLILTWTFVGLSYFVTEFYPQPMLEIENWAKAKPLEDFLSENEW